MARIRVTEYHDLEIESDTDDATDEELERAHEKIERKVTEKN